MRQADDPSMHTNGDRADDLSEVARVLLLVQASILVATTIEALVFGAAFAGGAGASFLLSAVAAIVLFSGRARLRADRRWTRRLIYVVEGVILAGFAIDVTLAILVVGGIPPAVALLTRFALPLSVIALLRRCARASAASPSRSASALEVAS